MKTLYDMNKDMLIKLLQSVEERHQSELKFLKFVSEKSKTEVKSKCSFKDCDACLVTINNKVLWYNCSDVLLCYNCFNHYCFEHLDIHQEVCARPFKENFNTEKFFKVMFYTNFESRYNIYATVPFNFLVHRHENGDVTIDNKLSEKGTIVGLNHDEKDFVTNSLESFSKRLEKFIKKRRV